MRRIFTIVFFLLTVNCGLLTAQVHTGHILKSGLPPGTVKTASSSSGEMVIDTSTSGAGSGSVTSVALSLPGIFTVSGSPVTTAGTLTGTLASQTANKVFASPNGSSGSPTFRALVSTDIPSLSYVTSVAASGDNGITISGSPITSSGTIAISIANSSIGDSSLALAYLKVSNNLSDILSASTARSNLGLGSSATHASSDYFLVANNLSEGTAATMRTNLGLGTLATQSGTFSGTSSGTNTGDQTITLTSDVTGSGTGSFATTIANSAVTLAKMANMATSSLIYRKTAGSGAPEVNTLATLKTDLNLTNTNSGDVTLAGENYLSLSSQVITANAVDLSGTNATGTLAAGRFPALTGDVTNSAGAVSTTVGAIQNKAITLATGYLKYTGSAWSFDNSTFLTGNQTITLSGDVTGSGTTAITTAIGANKVLTANILDANVTLAKIASIADQTILGNNTGASAAPVALTATQAKTVLAIANTDVSGLGSLATLSAAPAGTLTGVTLAGGVTASSLTSFGASPTLVTPILGTPTSGTLTNCTFPTLNQNTTGTANIAGGTDGAIPYQSAANTTTVLAATATANKVLMSGASAAPVWSTPAFPNASATSGKTIRSNGTDWVASTATLSDAPGTAGKVMISDGTNWIASTPTYPNATATSRKIVVGDGTNYVASTETWAVPGATGNALISDGTNWTAVAGFGWTTLKVSGSDFTRTAQTLADITGLITATLSTATLYEFEAVLYCTTSAVTTGVQFGVSCTGTGSPVVMAVYTGPTTSTAGTVTSTNASSSAETPAMLTTSAASGFVCIKGIVLTGTGSPVLSIQGLKVTSGTLTVKVGSTLRYRAL